MTPLLFPLLVAALMPQSASADSLYRLALAGHASALVLEARSRSLALRAAVADAMARARVPRESDAAILAARALAQAHAAAWRDSFLVREVEKFARRPAAQRVAKVRADSLRRAGVAAYTRDGPAAAVRIWRRALAGARAIADTASMAATLDNIGAALVALGRLDSAAVSLNTARRLASAARDARVEANITSHLGDLNADRGNLAAAREHYLQARALRERIGDAGGAAADLNNLGLVAQDAGDIERARQHFEAALAINRREGRDQNAATNLVNLAGVASLDGDFARAGAHYRDALAIWRTHAAWAEAAVALYGLGQLEIRRGDYVAAQAALLDATRIFDRTGPPDEGLSARRALADAFAAAGDLQQAIEQLRQAEALADSVGVPAHARAGLALARADLAVRLNALAQAERHYDDAARLYREARDADGEAEARHGLAALFLARDDPARAQTLLAGALRTQVAARHRRAAALTRLTLGRVSWELDDSAGARRQVAEAARELARLDDPVGAASALGEQAALEAEARRPAVAESLYRVALRRIEGRVAPGVRSRLHAGLALALRARGDVNAAARELRVALDEGEQPTRSLVLPERRSAFLADKWEVYAQLAFVERERGLTTAAFEASERLRAREMLELLERGRVQRPSQLPDELVDREQDLRRRINELTLELERASRSQEPLRGPDLTLASGETRQALLRAQDEYADLLLRMRERAPSHVAAVRPATASWREVARRLAPDQAFITYLLGDSGSVAFVVSPDTLLAVDLGASRREVARLVEFVRGSLELRRADSSRNGPWRRLHALLVGPIEETRVLDGKARLVIAPHAELHYLPFAALIDGGEPARFVGERYELTMAPSASVWLALGDRRTEPEGAGILAFAPRPDALPASRREVAVIERLGGSGAFVRTGDAATEASFRREAPTRRILHLATYGVLNKHNPLFSFVELAPGGGHDGRLDVHEVFGLALAAELVVLSACQTGIGSGALADVPPGDDWVGLTRAFLHAGAARVVASLWPVEDWATAALMEHFYRELGRGADPAAALAAAQRALRANRATASRFFWAGFVIIGGADALPR
jgi:CHAT domain-containing protein